VHAFRVERDHVVGVGLPAAPARERGSGLNRQRPAFAADHVGVAHVQVAGQQQLHAGVADGRQRRLTAVHHDRLGQRRRRQERVVGDQHPPGGGRRTGEARSDQLHLGR
jgi:hypothetical protein